MRLYSTSYVVSRERLTVLHGCVGVPPSSSANRRGGQASVGAVRSGRPARRQERGPDGVAPGQGRAETSRRVDPHFSRVTQDNRVRENMAMIYDLLGAGL